MHSKLLATGLWGEFFTSPDYSPVRSLAMNADLGIVQVVLQGAFQWHQQCDALCTQMTEQLHITNCVNMAKSGVASGKTQDAPGEM